MRYRCQSVMKEPGKPTLHMAGTIDSEPPPPAPHTVRRKYENGATLVFRLVGEATERTTGLTTITRTYELATDLCGCDLCA